MRGTTINHTLMDRVNLKWLFVLGLLIWIFSPGQSVAAYAPQKLLEPVFVQNIVAKERDPDSGDLWYVAGVFLADGDYVLVRVRAEVYQKFRRGKNLSAGYFPILPSLENIRYFRSNQQ